MRLGWWLRFASALALLVTFASDRAFAAQLVGSRESLAAQVRVAVENDFTLLETAAHVRRFVELGFLIPVKANRDLRLSGVSFPVARPEVKTFVGRLAAQYRRACGEKLVVTSLTRPRSGQPRNAYARSVHRTGMGVDLRRSRRTACRRWLERVLGSLEEQGVLEATRERRPAHYHVAVFPKRYARYVRDLTRKGRGTLETGARDSGRYRVRRGDTLWEIARRHRTTVEELREANGLERTTIVAGETLTIPRGF